MRIRFGTLACTLVLLAVTAGCSAVAGPSGGPVPSDHPAAGAPGEVFLPINAYMLTLPQLGQLQRARDLLVARCLRRFGYSLDAAPDAEWQSQVADFGIYGNLRRYGIAEPATASRYGYHLPSTLAGATATPAASAPARSPQLEGCRTRADAELSPTGRLGQDTFVSGMSTASYTWSLRDRQVIAGIQAWVECMAARGFRYDSPADAGASFEVDSPAVSPAELAVARADAACKQRVGLVKTWRDEEARYQRTQIAHQSKRLRRVLDNNAVQLTRSGRVLADQ